MRLFKQAKQKGNLPDSQSFVNSIENLPVLVRLRRFPHAFVEKGERSIDDRNMLYRNSEGREKPWLNW
ncbi:hypothetical protein PanWU01x14_248900, partial [Parasponia andersonii]